MTNIWVVVADSSRAKILTADTAIGPLREVEDLVHPQARLHEQDLTSDLPGRSFDSVGHNRHAMEQSESPKQHEAVNFAHRLAETLDTARLKHRFDRLIVVAAPAFLGLLRDIMSDETQKLISIEIAKNITRLDAAAIRDHLPERL